MTALHALLRLLLLPLLAVPVLLVASAPPAAACSCEQVPDVPRWGDEVFAATILEAPDADEGEVSVEAAVTRVWRGAVPERVTVSTYLGETSCGEIELEPGQVRLFDLAAGDVADGSVYIGGCGGGAVLRPEVVAELERDLGPGTTRDVPPGLVETDALGSSGDGRAGEPDQTSRALLAFGLLGAVGLSVGGVVAATRLHGARARR